MAVLNLPGKTEETLKIKKFDERVEFIINKNLSSQQRSAGIVAKVQVRHPAVSFIATVWQSKDGRKWVSEPAQARNKGWFPLVSLDKEVKDYILYLVDHNEEDNSAWYLDMVDKDITIRVTNGSSNPGLGIEAITIDNNLTYKQHRSGMICKVNLVTTIGSFFGYTAWCSKFGDSLYGTAPAEGSASDNAQRGNPGYRLSREATAQVLAYLHGMVDFKEKPDIPLEDALEDLEDNKENMKEGFEPVGDSMFGVDK